MPELSVVMATTRVDSYCIDAIDSVLGEEVDLELILVLDGCRDVIPEKLAAHEKVVVVRLPRNMGTPTALNAGLSSCRGEYVARLDADDLCVPGRMQTQLNYLRGNPEVALVASAAELIDGSGLRIGSFGRGMDSDQIARELVSRNPIVHSSVMFRRAEVAMVGAYNVDCKRMQDYELFLRLALSGAKLVVIPQELVSYRVHALQSSRSSPPWGPGFRTILRRRRALARVHAMPIWRIWLRQEVWRAAQLLRHLGFRGPGYMKGGSS